MPLETFIDDTDPSVEFSPSIDWPTVTPQNGYPEGVTARVADIPNINFSASLNFTGTGIRVIGIWMEGINQPTASYTIDGDILPYSPVPSPSSQATAGGMHMNITYFAKQDLPYGPHSLVIRPIMTGNPTGYEYVLDGFFVSRPNSEQDGGNNTVAESAVSRLANATSFSSDHSTTPALGTQTSSTSLPTTTATAGAVSGRNRRENLAGIVGGAVGGLFVLLLALFFTCRRKRWKVS
ncbi:hypothetical protein C8Q80DRAFT_301950 [Daedaleopsis nitida]|nr:hypothetical protein C8Q80DRAFT_301950 [Daedaleopsis nitida]